MSYFVIAPNGQKFGPADVATLNQWIAEGRIMPETLLEEEATRTQLVARVVPFLVFLPHGQTPMPTGPTVAPPDANPYLTPLPPQHQRQIHQGYYPHSAPEIAGVTNGQIIAAWVCTFVAPLVMFLCYFGLALALFGIITGVQLKRQGENQGIALVAINVIWLIGWVLVRAIFGFPF